MSRRSGYYKAAGLQGEMVWHESSGSIAQIVCASGKPGEFLCRDNEGEFFACAEFLFALQNVAKPGHAEAYELVRVIR